MFHPFLKDDLGNGYQSWSDKMVERTRNVIKRDSKTSRRVDDGEVTPSTKRRKKEVELLRRYPVTGIVQDTAENADSLQELNKAIHKEMAKKKPRDPVLLPLMKSTYGDRRIYILNITCSVNSVLEKYPALSRPAVMEQEMGQIFDQPSFKSQFYAHWLQYVEAILLYAEQCGKKGVMNVLKNLDRDDETSKHLTSLKVLCSSLGKGEQSLCYVYEEYESTDSIITACTKPPKRTQPRIAAMIGEEGTQYFIICEQSVLLKINSFKAALFFTVAAYYVFNLEYPQAANNIFNFLQDYILKQPDSNKKSASYLAVVSDIKRSLS